MSLVGITSIQPSQIGLSMYALGFCPIFAKLDIYMSLTAERSYTVWLEHLVIQLPIGHTGCLQVWAVLSICCPQKVLIPNSSPFSVISQELSSFHVKFWYTIHLNLLLWGLRSLYSLFAVWYSVYSAPFILYFLTVYAFAPLSEIMWQYLCRSISGYLWVLGCLIC